MAKSLRQIIVNLGQLQSVIVITLFSCLTSVLVTLVIAFVYSQLGIYLNILSHITIASLVPLVLTPPISWFIIGLLLKVNQLEVEMRRAATFDALTGLLNRHAFMEQANYVFRLAERERFEISVLVVDLDHFKSINDNFGHANGDKVLETFGKVVSQIVRRSDLACRLGGEEFAFLLPNTSAEQAWDFSKRLHEVIKKTVVEHNGFAIQFTLSIGIAAFPKDSVENVEKSLNIADKAMYHAKRNGRNQSVIYNENHDILKTG